MTLRPMATVGGQHGAVFTIVDLPGPPIAAIGEVTEAFRAALAKLTDPWTGFDDRTGSTRHGLHEPYRHFHAPLYIFYRKAPMQYTARRTNDFTAHG
jgi:hypothetical protein